MGNRPGRSSRVRTSEDKVRRKDKCWSVRAVYILEKLPNVHMSEDKVRRKDLCGSVRVVYVLEKLPDISGSGLVEAGRYRMVSELTLAVS